MWSGLPQKRVHVLVTNTEAGRKDQVEPNTSSSSSSRISMTTQPEEKAFEKLLAKADEKLAKKLSINKPSKLPSSTKAKNSADNSASSKRKIEMTRQHHELFNVERHRNSSPEKKSTTREPREGYVDKKNNKLDSTKAKETAGADLWKNDDKLEPTDDPF